MAADRLVVAEPGDLHPRNGFIAGQGIDKAENVPSGQRPRGLDDNAGMFAAADDDEVTHALPIKALTAQTRPSGGVA